MAATPQSHLCMRTVPSTGYQLSLMPSVAPSGHALVFVHGYRGDSRTWRDFPTLLSGDAGASGHDVFVYDYDGVYSELTASSLIFRSFLERLLERSAEAVNQSLSPGHQRPADFRFARVVIVAHSLGAVIARNALVYAVEDEAAWADRCRMVLFAPAHRGANVRNLAVHALGGIPGLRELFSIARFRSPLIDQLSPESEALDDLRKRAAAQRDRPGAGCLRPSRVVIAEREHVVVNLPFPGDPTPSPIPGTTHTSVCKPRVDFRAPYDHLKEGLR